MELLLEFVIPLQHRRHPLVSRSYTVFRSNVECDPDYLVFWTFHLPPWFTPENQCSVYRINVNNN